MAQPPRELSDGERLDWLRLARTDSVGPITFRGLIERFGDARAALEALPELARRGGRRRGLTPAPLADAEREAAAVAALGGRMVALGEPDYPEPLAAIEDAPPVLSVLGRRDLMSRRSVAVVGARNASGNGRRDRGQAGAGAGHGGADRGVGPGARYRRRGPRGRAGHRHRGRRRRRHRRGLSAREREALPAHLPRPAPWCWRRCRLRHPVPQARHFPRRNRLVSGVSLAWASVVEAAPQLRAR